MPGSSLHFCVVCGSVLFKFSYYSVSNAAFYFFDVISQFSCVSNLSYRCVLTFSKFCVIFKSFLLFFRLEFVSLL